MTATSIIQELEQLPLKERLHVIEETLKSVKKEKNSVLQQAVDTLYDDYAIEEELTVFTQLDSEPFYETK